jgi:hypothetical protein
MVQPTFACPACGSNNVKVIDAQRTRAYVPFPAAANTTEPAIAYSLECRCGASFAETLRESEASGLPALS